MTNRSPEQVVADALTKYWLKSGSQYSTRLDEGTAAIEALHSAGYAIVQLPSVAYKGPNDTDAQFFRQVANRMENPSVRVDCLSGGNVREAVRRLLYRASDAAERLGR